MATLADVTFDDGAISVAGAPGVTAIGSLLIAAAPPESADFGELGGAIRLGPESTISLATETPWPVDGFVVEIVLRPDPDQLAILIGAGPIRVQVAAVAGGVAVLASAETSTGSVTTLAQDAGLNTLSWNKLTLAFIGNELVVFSGDRVHTRRVLRSPQRLVESKVISIGGHEGTPGLSADVAAIRIHDGLPVALAVTLEDARAAGEGELESLAAELGHLTAESDVTDVFVRSSRHRSYQLAELVWHPATGAHGLTGATRDLWLETGGQAGPLGYPLADATPAADYFGPWMERASAPPIGAPEPIGSPGEVTRFESGLVFAHDGLAHMVSGEILVRWLVHGGSAGYLGRPIGAESVVGTASAGRKQDFEGGTIWWHPRCGANALTGSMLQGFIDHGGVDACGFPTGEQVETAHGALLVPCEAGRLQAASGAEPVYLLPLDFVAAYETAGGATTLGSVTSDVIDRPTGVRFATCELGLLAQPLDGPALAVTTLELRLVDAFAPVVDDGIELIGTDRTSEIYVFVTTEISHGGAATVMERVRFDSQEDDSRRVILDLKPATIDGVRPDTRIRVAFDAWDHDQLSGDDRLGSYEITFDIDNVWGLSGQMAGVHEAHAPGGDGEVIYTLSLAPREVDPRSVAPANFREHLWWRFDNFSTQRLDRELFTETFEDVEAPEAVPLDLTEVFYELAYAGSAKGGNCYGMSKTALETITGVGVYPAPLSRYGPAGGGLIAENDLDATFRRGFNRRQGSQLSGTMTAHLLRALANGRLTRADLAYDEVAKRVATGEVVVLSMYHLATGSGHAVLGYQTAQADGVRSIFVADPNTPWITHSDGRDWRPMGSSRIDVAADGSWQFFHLGGEPHPSYRGIAGATVPESTLFVVPASVINAPVRTPLADIGMMLPWLTGALIVLGGAHSEEVAFGGDAPAPYFGSHVDTLWGLRNYQGSEIGPGDGWMSPQRLAEMYGPVATSAPGMFRLPIFDGAPIEMYGRTGRFPDEYRHKVVGDGSAEAVSLMVDTGRHTFATRGPLSGAATMELDARRLTTATPTLSLAGSGSPVLRSFEYSASLWHHGPVTSVSTWLPVGSNVTSQIQLLGRGSGIQLLPGADIEELNVFLSGANGSAPATVRIGSATAGGTVVLVPADPVSPRGEQMVVRRTPDGSLIERMRLQPGG